MRERRHWDEMQRCHERIRFHRPGTKDSSKATRAAGCDAKRARKDFLAAHDAMGQAHLAMLLTGCTAEWG
ncbi:MAG TPA: hypothetical protein VEV39_11425 [Gemmatimonadales bacterium]|nr:hypothetical protein [Gemmatimonadales bacterium]